MKKVSQAHVVLIFRLSEHKSAIYELMEELKFESEDLILEADDT